jgi:hypothetical protein
MCFSAPSRTQGLLPNEEVTQEAQLPNEEMAL